MKKKNLQTFLSGTFLIFLTTALTACSMGSKKSEDDLDSLQDENAAALTDAGTDAVNGATVSTAKEGQAVTAAASFTAPKTEAFEVDGVWMNAYYYVRSKDETLASVSQALYGTPDREKDLSKWNHRKKVSVGSLLYYSSATRTKEHADHAKILSFAEDKGMALEEIEVKQGETISKIAQNRFGDFKAWREIAALNPTVDPNHIAPGTKLKIAPGGTPAAVAAATAAPTDSAVVPAIVETPAVAQQNTAPQAPLQAPSQAHMMNQMSNADAAPAAPVVNNVPTPAADPMANTPSAMDTQAEAPKRGPASVKTKPGANATDREPAEASGLQGKIGPALEMFQENPALAGAVGLLALGLIGLGVRRLRSS